MSLPAHTLRCATHPDREAAARCTGCGGFFCRECVTEHDLEMLCAPCIRKATEVGEAPAKSSRIGLVLLPLAQAFLGILILWICLYLAGRALIAIPSTFHEGTIWEEM